MRILTHVTHMINLALMTAPEVKTVAEVAARLGVSVSTVQRWADDGRLTPIRERPALFDGAEVDKLAAELAEELKARLGRLEASA